MSPSTEASATDDGTAVSELSIPPGVLDLLAALHRRWAPHLLFLLGERPARFAELQRAVPGLSATSLSDRLRDLVDAGLIERQVLPGPPMSSLYTLTSSGQKIAVQLRVLAATDH